MPGELGIGLGINTAQAKPDSLPAQQTIYPKVRCWYTGVNVDGKPAGFMPYADGGLTYFEFVRRVIEAGYCGYTPE